MNADPRQWIESGPLPYLVSVPRSDPPASGFWPLLCFLHGYGEGGPGPIEPALTRHGPLAAGSSPLATVDFLVVAPRLPARGDLWHRHAEAIEQVVRQVLTDHRVDSERVYLTGFSFGGNGVLDLAQKRRETWAALWPVDPTRVPPEDPGRPVWLSSGEISRHFADTFIRRLHLQPDRGSDADARAGANDRVYEDRGQDHMGTARLAYQDDRIYRWLLSKRGSSPAV
jgi:predicted peptidase